MEQSINNWRDGGREGWEEGTDLWRDYFLKAAGLNYDVETTFWRFDDRQ